MSIEALNASRRVFLKVAVGSGFALGLGPIPSLAEDIKKNETTSLAPTQQVSAFIHIDDENIVTITLNRLEMGQGVYTGLPMILADELDANWSDVRVVFGGAEPEYVDPLFKMHLTAASSAIRNSFQQYRELGARYRLMLLTAAASKLDSNIAELRTEDGFVISRSGQRLAYSALAGDAMALPIPATVELKEPKNFKLIGRSVGRLDTPPKSRGEQDYGIDLRLPGMLTAVIVRPPQFGARIKAINDAEALATRGVRAVLRVPIDFGGESVAVIAEHYWAAQQGRNALKLEWSLPENASRTDTETLFNEFRQVVAQRGSTMVYDADTSALATAPKKLSARIEFPFLLHGAMEPLNCAVRCTNDSAEIWVATQIPGLDVRAASEVLQMPASAINLHNLMAGGAFGRRSTPNSDFIVEACQVARAALRAGITEPVKTIWSREDDTASGYYRPMYVHRADIGFDDSGNILAWEHVIAGQSAVKDTVYEAFMMRNGIDITVTNGMKTPYEIPMNLSLHYMQVDVPVATWRSVGNSHTCFVMQTLIDEVARQTNQDPVSYRLRLLGEKGEQQKAALKLAAEKSGYGKNKLPEGRAWGVAAHDMSGSSVAYVVEASMVNGRPKLHKITAGVNCGLAVNPLSVEAQIQGGIVMALGTCLPGSAITFKDGRLGQYNFDRFRVARNEDIPEIEVHILPSAGAPTGVGEIAVPPLTPAFANAIARLTGKAPTALPFEILA